MNLKILIKKDSYHDSVTLMALSGKIAAIEGVNDAVVVMATDMNKELLQRIEIYNKEIDIAGTNDLIIAVRAKNESICIGAIQTVEETLTKKQSFRKNGKQINPSSIESAIKMVSNLNLAIISVPGQYAAREAMQALKNNLHVMIFSDNVSIKEEIALKKFAHKQGLLIMGPDCGTAIINNFGLCFANVVKAGNIGIIGASGTGTQEVSVLIDRLGEGISQVIGTGGRDLSEAVGGITMLDSLDALQRHNNTEIIVLISKPPSKKVTNKIFDKLKNISKPIVICFLNYKDVQMEKTGVYFCKTLEATAHTAVAICKKENILTYENKINDLAIPTNTKFLISQKYIRGLFCGGTLCVEAINIVKDHGLKIYSNITKNTEEILDDPHNISKGNTFIDLGDDIFTKGKPHPMIEPSLRLPRILKEAADPETAVILMDFVLGYGSHPDPVGSTLPTIIEAKRIAIESGRNLEIIGYVCGTEQDIQGSNIQMQKLASAGVLLAKSNAQAARLASLIVKKREEMYI